MCEVMEKYDRKLLRKDFLYLKKQLQCLRRKSPSEVVLTGVPQNIVDRAMSRYET